jgi:two-component system, NtrC family, sensor kinase
MKPLLLTLFLLGMTMAYAQFGPTNSPTIESLRHELSRARHDTNRVLIMVTLCDLYRSTDSAQYFGQQAVELSRKIDFRSGEIRAMSLLGRAVAELGNLPQGFQLQLKALQIAEANRMGVETGHVFNQIGNLYTYLEDFVKAKNYYRQSLAFYEKYHNQVGILTEKMQLGRAFEELNQLDSALYYENQAYDGMLRIRKNELLINPLVYRNLGRIYSKLGNDSLALANGHKALFISRNTNFQFGYAFTLVDLGLFFKRLGRTDSSIYYAKQGLALAQHISNKRIILKAGLLLSELYETIDTEVAFRYYKLAMNTKDSLFGSGAMQAIQQMLTQEQQRKKEIEAQKQVYQSQLRQYALFAILSVSLLIAFILYLNNSRQKKANSLLFRQKEEINHQRHNAEKALDELKTAQTQLIQREKMASLGELTAGIAHEIQNPLNFVNNFSEVSEELIEEMQEELQKGEIEEAKSIANDIRLNLQKINHHGKRAGSIVSGMLEHSRNPTGERQSTELNALADEYLRLAYQGLRAKNKSFNCELIAYFESSLSPVEVVPQEIGRVLLNLYNNAFYAVYQKQLTASADYQPTIWVSTQQANGQVQIKIKDNGIGIPESIRAKIFQPFFTTKPTGEGTGLGLSLSYDIVTKGHGGTLEVESVEGEGTEFIISLSPG